MAERSHSSLKLKGTNKGLESRSVWVREGGCDRKKNFYSCRVIMTDNNQLYISK